ncbi:hypothetical protein LBW89_11845 [Paenibacillus sp. alder61]|uniref:hypothetical protein n=1 Tax=Paenibacillus sp. alder61 TaxID=2862948 RepID=UPI001CD49757|nr:hypothetical protein [Paenibacillus sp. alder61]MCA1293709.1 hypothetical protein [Paenibacillus sp. alder61]
MDSRELDQADKKLRSLDKLLQQTQRRASVLGKTKIAPKITLEDRFTAAADKVERRLSKLQRTTVRPIVGLADGVTAAAARIRASLLGLTGTPWRVRVEGVDWDGVIGKPLMELLGNESMFMEAGKKAGTAFFQSFLSAFDSKSLDALTGGKSGGSGEKSAESGAGEKEDKTFLDKLMGFGEDIEKFSLDLGKDVLKDLLKDEIKGLFDKMRGKDDKKTCICICKCNCGGGSGGLLDGDLGSDSEDDGKKKKKPKRKKGRGSKNPMAGLDNESKDPTKSSNRNKAEQGGKSKGARGVPGKTRSGRWGGLRIGSWLSDGMNSLKNTGANWLQNGKSRVVNGVSSIKEKSSGLLKKGGAWIGNGFSWLKEKGSGLLSKGGEWVGKGVSFAKEKGSNLLKQAGGWFGKGMKFMGKIKLPGPLGLLTDVGAFATAGSKRDKTKAVTSSLLSMAGGAVGGFFGSIVPGAGTAAGAGLGSMAGDFLGDKLGGFLFDLFKKPEKKSKAQAPAAIADTPAMRKPLQRLPERPQIPSKKDENREFPVGTQGMAPAVPKIDVVVSKGAINLTINKDEINYDELANLSGRKIANEIRLAMQNVG